MSARATTDAAKRAVLDRILAAWLRRPSERLGQFIANATRMREDGHLGASESSFYTEDEPLAVACERYASRALPATPPIADTFPRAPVGEEEREAVAAYMEPAKWCNARTPRYDGGDGDWFCTRLKRHVGDHVAALYDKSVLARWPQSPPTPKAEPPAEVKRWGIWLEGRWHSVDFPGQWCVEPDCKTVRSFADKGDAIRFRNENWPDSGAHTICELPTPAAEPSAKGERVTVGFVIRLATNDGARHYGDKPGAWGCVYTLREAHRYPTRAAAWRSLCRDSNEHWRNYATVVRITRRRGSGKP